MGNLKTCHNEVRVSLADLFQNDPGVNQESKETALISNQSTLEFGTVEIRDRTGREAALQYALLQGEQGSAMLTVFDTGATGTIVKRKLIENGEIKALSWGNYMQVKGLNDRPTMAQEATVMLHDEKGGQFQIVALVQDSIVQTIDRNTSPILLQYGINTLSEKLPEF